jgi:hypothetical protein
MGIQEQGWFMNIIRSIFSFLDGLVYGLIKWILFGIFDLTNVTTNSAVFSDIYSRLYVILGIFMAFKLSFSFFQYIIDPESMTGKSDKSLSKVFSRVFIMLAALIFLPQLLFSGIDGKGGILYRAQTAFLPTLPKIIFGVDSLGGLSTSSGVGTGSNFSDSVEQAANDITVTIMQGFFAPPEDLDEYCDNGTYAKTPPIKSIDEFKANVNLDCPKRGDIAAHTIGFLGAKFYKYSYMWFISTVVGVLVALLLLGITFDIAKRVFKLMILEVIAPVPIMSLIDPKGNKDGAFRKWVSSLTSTFLDIFFKLGIVYLIIVFIHLIVNSGNKGGLFSNFPENAGFRGTYLKILLILGLILFAKEAPKFIKDALGMKGEGGGLLDDVKSVGKAAGLVGGAAVGTAGIIGSTVGSIRAQHQGNKEENDAKGKNLGRSMLHGLRNVGAGLSGIAGGTAAGVKGLTGKDAGIKSVMKNQQERNASDFEYRRNGGTLFGRIGSGVSRAFTGETGATRIGREIEQNEANQALLKSITDRASSEMVKSNYTYGSLGKNRGGGDFTDKAGNSLTGVKFNYKEMMSAFDSATATGSDYVSIADETGVMHDIKYQDVAFGKGNLLKENEEDYLLKANNSLYTHIDSTGATVFDISDETIKTHMENAQKAGIKDANGSRIDVRKRKDLKDGQESLARDTATKKLQQARKQANDKYNAKKK